MKAALVLLPVFILLSVGLLGVSKIRRKELDSHIQQRKFREIKMQVNIDLMAESSATITQTQKLLEKTQGEIKDLTEKYNVVVARAEQAKTNWEDCSGDQKLFNDMIGESQSEFSTLKNTYAEEKNQWKMQTDLLKEQLKRRSPLCLYLIPGQHNGRMMCGSVSAAVVVANQKPKNPQIRVIKVKRAVLLHRTNKKKATSA